MILTEFREREAAGEVPEGRVRGVILAYARSHGTAEEFHEQQRVTLRVTESDLEEIVPGQEISLGMSDPRDPNLMLGDLEVGFRSGGMDPVPVESEVTFVNCAMGLAGEVEAMGYEVETIERPEPAPGPGFR